MKEISVPFREYDKQFYIIGLVNNKITAILIDTGSCMSYIASEIVEEIYEAPKAMVYENYHKERVICDKVSTVELILDGEIKFNIEILVDYNDKETDMILGMDFLENFKYALTNKEIILYIDEEQYTIPRINLEYNLLKAKLQI